MKKLWIGILILVILTPLGLIIPAYLGGGTAWGEWSADELRKLIGYVPAGMQKARELWHTPMADYEPVKGPLHMTSLGYLLSAVVGLLVTLAVAFGVGRLLARKDRGVDS